MNRLQRLENLPAAIELMIAQLAIRLDIPNTIVAAWPAETWAIIEWNGKALSISAADATSHFRITRGEMMQDVPFGIEGRSSQEPLPLRRGVLAVPERLSARSLKMLSKTIAEVSKRSRETRIVALTSDERLARDVGFDEVFPELTGAELENLMLQSTCFFELAEDGSFSSYEAHVAADLGRPVVSATSTTPNSHLNRLAVASWNADDFADVLLGASLAPMSSVRFEEALQVVKEYLTVE